LHNYQNHGGTWKEHGITRDRVLWRMQAVQQGAPDLWATVQHLIDQSIERGYLQL
jgi:putative hydrolase of HD superfamily